MRSGDPQGVNSLCRRSDDIVDVVENGQIAVNNHSNTKGNIYSAFIMTVTASVHLFI